MGLLSYRTATAADVELLVAWHADPEIARYWDGETFTGEQIQHRLERKTVDMWIVEEDGEPVGYLQSWWETGVGSTEPAKSAGAGLAGAGAEVEPPLRGGLDGFLVPAARGRGIMPAVAHTLATDLLAQGWSYVTVDPYACNTRAIHALAARGVRRGLATRCRRRAHVGLGADALRGLEVQRVLRYPQTHAPADDDAHGVPRAGDCRRTARGLGRPASGPGPATSVCCRPYRR